MLKNSKGFCPRFPLSTVFLAITICSLVAGAWEFDQALGMIALLLGASFVGALIFLRSFAGIASGSLALLMLALILEGDSVGPPKEDVFIMVLLIYSLPMLATAWVGKRIGNWLAGKADENRTG